VLRSDPTIFFDDYTTGAVAYERKLRLPVEELRASYMELANESDRRLFQLYGLDKHEVAG
jgi:hypothetical protein